MLAEKHTRVKYSINPRGNVWSNDEDKFGQKMLEKFGWEKGKGLGLREDGCKEHVKVSKKNDSKGLGFKKVFGDNLISHQDDFNSLLNSLSETHTSVSHAAADDVIKLTEKSCSARKRVHYHKHVKGKDLSGRTAEDMDCIFGRRKMKMKQSKTELVSSLPLSSEVVVPDAAAANIALNSESAGKQVTEEKHGVFTINTGKSISEYFAMKMTGMTKGAHSQETHTEPTQRESLIAEPTDLDCAMEDDCCPEQATKDKSDCPMDLDHCPEEAIKKKSKKKKKEKRVMDEEFVEEKTCELKTDVDCGHNYELVGNYDESVETTSESIRVRHKKKKDKDKKCRETASDVVDCGDKNDISYEEIVCTTSEAKRKKSKKKKKKVQDCEVVDSENILHNSVEESTILLNPGEQSTILLNSEEQSTVPLNLEDTEKNAETKDGDFTTKRKKKKKKRSREEMDNFSKEDSLPAGLSDKNVTEECSAPNVLHESEQSTILLNSEEQSTVLLNLEDTEKNVETKDGDFTTKRKKKKRSREEMDNFSKEDSLPAGLSDKNVTEECSAPNVLHESEQSTILLNSEEQSTVLLNLEDTEKNVETKDGDFTTKRKKKKKSREEMDNFSKEDSLPAGLSDKNVTEECSAPKSRKNEEQLKKECDVLHESVNEKERSKSPDTTVYSHCTFGNSESTKVTQLEISMEPMERKDIKHNTEAIQSALVAFEILGANVLEIIGYSI